MSEPGFSQVGFAPNKIRVFVSYDREHDEDLHDRLVEEASRSTSGIEISARSTSRPTTDLRDERLRRAVREVDLVIVLCGEHTVSSGRMGAELRIAQEEQRPYLLLWGRRELMCTRPATARPADSMYSWTWEILQNQILNARRLAGSSERMTGLARAKASPER